jgi:AcrR family transcriptional regulator
MVRWEPNARGRLQQAAMTLFYERGFDTVTVADIAERAGMTTRSYFNHFADKPAVVFAALDTFAGNVVDNLALAEAELSALDATVRAFAQTAASLSLDQPEQARALRALIDTSAVLRERERTKMAAAAAAISNALTERGVSRRDAAFVAHTATLVFTTAYDEWANDPKTDLPSAIQATLADYRHALGATSEPSQP